MNDSQQNSAPGAPGISARWTSSAKSGVGTALSDKIRVWFTLSHGIFNEIYYPRIDQACIRDMGLIVTDGAEFFSEEKRHAGHTVEWLADGVPAFRLVNTCRDGRYRIEKQIVTDPHRDTVLQQVQFHAQQGALSDYHLHVLLAPHLGNHGGGNTAWVGEFQGTPLLFARRNDCALALVRFGLRAADDPRIRDTANVIDALLKVETPNGATWHRYNDDGYGEHEDGSPFDGTGIGRGWPLLTGERAHYELAAGREAIAKTLLSAMESFATESGFISEQVWDSPDIAERELHCGQPSGSAMPLVWAHAEYLKLRRSLRDGRLFDQPPQTVQRYLKDKTVSPRLTWRFNHKLRSLPPGKILRIELMAPAVIHWTADDWKTCQDVTTHDAGLGIHMADLPTKSLPEGKQIKFTFYWPDASHWEGNDFMVRIAVWRREDFVSAERNETHGE